MYMLTPQLKTTRIILINNINNLFLISAYASNDFFNNLRSRSAIEAHRTRLASWKRSMPPLSPKIKDFRGPRTLESYGEADRSTEGR